MIYKIVKFFLHSSEQFLSNFEKFVDGFAVLYAENQNSFSKKMSFSLVSLSGFFKIFPLKSPLKIKALKMSALKLKISENEWNRDFSLTHSNRTQPCLRTYIHYTVRLGLESRQRAIQIQRGQQWRREQLNSKL